MLNFFFLVSFLTGNISAQDRKAMNRLETRLSKANTYSNFEFSIHVGDLYDNSIRSLSRRVYELERYVGALEFSLWLAEDRITRLENTSPSFLGFECTLSVQMGRGNYFKYTGKGRSIEEAQDEVYVVCRNNQSLTSCKAAVRTGYSCSTL